LRDFLKRIHGISRNGKWLPIPINALILAMSPAGMSPFLSPLIKMDLLPAMAVPVRESLSGE